MFYSWRKIYKKTGGSGRRVILALKAHLSTSIPKNRYDPLYPYYTCDFNGSSYLLKPWDLLNNEFRWTPREVGQYIGLASFRSWAEYQVTGDASLDLFHSPMKEETINNNRLLRIKDGRIYFYYEEDTSRRNIIWH